ncbi:MAG TPA: hypothetical protein VF274_10800 [Alphaproteobacteria bacterium]|jgi:hypothetical protein
MSARRRIVPTTDSLTPPRPPQESIALGRLGFYDTLAEREWVRLGAAGRHERRRAYQAVAAALALARQQERPRGTLERLEATRRGIVAEHRATLRWRRRQERRRQLVRALLFDRGSAPWPR